MTLTNIEISIVSQCALGLASVIGLLYKTNHYKKIWKTRYKLQRHEMKSSVLLSSCKLVWGMMVCHIFNIFTADIKCPLLLDQSLTYYPMYTLISGFELGYIFIEPIMVHLLRKIGIIYNINGLKYPDIYPNMKEVHDMIDIKIFFIIFIAFFGTSLSIYLANEHTKSYVWIFVFMLIIGSLLVATIFMLPLYLENDKRGMRKIHTSVMDHIYITRKDMYINIGSWIFIKILMKTIWTLYILKSPLKDDLCSIAQNATFNNKITNAFFYMVFCSMIINIVSVCYQYIFMNGDKIKAIQFYYHENTRMKKLTKIMANVIFISLCSSIIWIFYFIEEVRGKNVNINYTTVALSTTLFPSGIYILFIVLKKTILHCTNYRKHELQLLMNDYNEL